MANFDSLYVLLFYKLSMSNSLVEFKLECALAIGREGSHDETDDVTSFDIVSQRFGNQNCIEHVPPHRFFEVPVLIVTSTHHKQVVLHFLNLLVIRIIFTSLTLIPNLTMIVAQKAPSVSNKHHNERISPIFEYLHLLEGGDVLRYLVLHLLIGFYLVGLHCVCLIQAVEQ